MNNEIQAIKDPKNIKDVVLNKVVNMQSTGGLSIPDGYNPTNSLHSAWLIFEGDKKLMNTSNTSKANALLKMVALGLDPGKTQGYFIPYAGHVQFQPSYHGNVMILKRDAGALTVNANVVYKGDEFKFEIDPKTGGRIVTKHEQTLESLDSKEPVGGWVTITFEDERLNHTEIMTYEQIKQAWMQSAMIKNEEGIKRSKTHNDFQEEMIKKTVINRAAKRFVNTTGVSINHKLADKIDEKNRKVVFDAEVQNEQATESLDFDLTEQMNVQPEQPEAETVEPELVEVEEQSVNTETGEINSRQQEAPEKELEENPFANSDNKPANDEETPF